MRLTFLSKTSIFPDRHLAQSSRNAKVSKLRLGFHKALLTGSLGHKSLSNSKTSRQTDSPRRQSWRFKTVDAIPFNSRKDLIRGELVKSRSSSGGGNDEETEESMDEQARSAAQGVEVEVIEGEGPSGTKMLFRHTVEARVQAPVSDVWQLWSDLQRAPEWMRWITSVQVVSAGMESSVADGDFDGDGGAEPGSRGQKTGEGPEPAELTRWMCSTGGFEVTWLAQCDTAVQGIGGEGEEDVRRMNWRTLEGLQSQGQVEFRPGQTGDTHILLQVSHQLPTQLGRLIGENALQGLVQATLQSDLTHFSELLLEDERSR